MAGVEKKRLTSKAIIHQKFGVEAIYRIEEFDDHYSLNLPCLYRCHLQTPDFSVVSNFFKNKEDAEESAAELALEEFGIQPRDDAITVEEAWDDIVERIKYIFSDEFVLTGHPLGTHLIATLQRHGDNWTTVPASVIATFDAKIISRCKVINPSADSDPSLVISCVMKAAAKLPDYVDVFPHEASLLRQRPHPLPIVLALATHWGSKSIEVEAVHVQCQSHGEEVVDSVTLDIPSGRYYLDVIAEKLGLKDSNQLVISRWSFGKASSGYECRVYSANPKMNRYDKSSKAYGKRPVHEDEPSHLKTSWNARASSVCGQAVRGDAIVASVGYPWRSQSHGLQHDVVTINSFYRICYNTSPNGIYKTSRRALIAAQLPFSFTAKSNWRGPFPREILSMYCRQHELEEPVFTVSTAPVKPFSDILNSHQKLKDSKPDDDENQLLSRKREEIAELANGYRCEVKILSKTSQDVVFSCSLRKFYEKENYAVENAALNALSWFGGFHDDPDADPLHPEYEDEVLDMLFQQKIRIKEFGRSSGRHEMKRKPSKSRREEYMLQEKEQKHVRSIPKGSLVTISYSVSLEVDSDMSRSGESLRELVEGNQAMEFEVGNGSMNRDLELVVTQMSVGQYARFITDSPSQGLVLAAATNTERVRSLFSEPATSLEYRVHLLAVRGPKEKRMEAMFFKPQLSKQRVEYAVKQIINSSASTLVDFGCGSGDLLDSLLDHQTSLQTIVGVDISQKALARAAKMLHTKLQKLSWNLQSVVLYDGSILEFDSRLHDADVGTCLEVIEHMEEAQAYEFGSIVLRLFRPKLLIVSTPNYEYNTVLNKSARYHQKDKPMSQRSKFRNHKHKFEWTRATFNYWATTLANYFSYSVEFSGVGGFKEDLGFASQIAVFKRESLYDVDVVEDVPEESMEPFKVEWEWEKGMETKKN
ncbi:unnamed protein product [Thlaspi arvense]|uniref:Small RNA 2'-O-methyltransferase n=1 Tax=Thlaspi arvense TaxID=13288 RepID=A0AAU9T6B5_THLAR|nr:unnamed protein product [Thlaspi arvense]